MSSATAFAGIEAYLRANWSATPIWFENENWKLPNPPAHFLLVEVFGDFYDQASIGADPQDGNLYRETGQIYVHVMVPRGQGTATATPSLDRATLRPVDRGDEVGALRKENEALRGALTFPVMVKPVHSHLFVRAFGKKLFIIEADFDEVWVVWAPDDLRLARLIESRGLSEQEARRRQAQREADNAERQRIAEQLAQLPPEREDTPQ